MRESARDKRNYIIAGLLLLTIFMAVGFAAFSTVLTINGTANIASSWSVQITNIRGVNYCIMDDAGGYTAPTSSSYKEEAQESAYSLQLLPGETTKNIETKNMAVAEPTNGCEICSEANTAYDVTAPTITNNNLTATFHTGLLTPGDTRIYEVEVSNLGSVDAKVTSSITNNSTEAIIFTYDGVSSTSVLDNCGKYSTTNLSTTNPFDLNKSSKKYLYIVVKYNENVTGQPTILETDLTLNLTATQK